MSIDVGGIRRDQHGFPTLSEFRFANNKRVQDLVDRLATVILDFHSTCGITEELSNGELLGLNFLKQYVLGHIAECKHDELLQKNPPA